MNVLYKTKKRKAKWNGHTWSRTCLIIHVIEGRTIGTRGRGGICKQLLDDLEKKRRYCNLKDDGLDRTLWRTRFGRGYGPVAKQTT
jgi:hypothetical protein